MRLLRAVRPVLHAPRKSRGAARLLRLPEVLVPVRAPRPSVTRRRLGAVLLTAVLGAFAAAEVGRQTADAWTFGADLRAGLGVAVAQGVILGVLFGLGWRRDARPARAAALGVLSAAGLATAGAWHTGVLDVARMAATAGACAAAAALARRSVRQHGGSAVRHLVCAADYPLVGAVALATPVTWLANSLGPDGVWAALPLAAFGGALLASVHASRGHAAPGGVALRSTVAGAWAAASAAPLLARDWRTGLAAVALAVGSGVSVCAWLRSHVRDRRFEQRTLEVTAPALVAAGSALVVTPAVGLTGVWTGAYLSLALLAGYVAAECRGRSEWATRIAWRRVGPATAAVAIVADVVRAVVTEQSALPWRVALAFAAARTGAALYHAHRAHVRALRASGRAPGARAAGGP